jgi:TetR/AcrR family transcriptional regulator, regulator of mycofactocin system
MASDSLRERKKAATHRELMAAALRLFEERGFDETTVEEIAAAADVAPRTFFRYFPAKVDILFADHQERVALLRETLATRSPDEPVVEAVRRASLAGVARVAADPSLFLTRSRLVASIPAAHAHGRHLDADFEDVISEAVLAGRKSDPATDLEARVVARTAWGAVCAARDAWLASDAELDPRELLNEAFDLVQHGLAGGAPSTG